MNRITITSMKTTGEVCDIGKAAANAIPSHGRYRYYVPVTYTGDNGQEFNAIVRGLTKPKLAERLANNQRYIDGRSLFYEQSSFDQSWHQVISFSLNMTYDKNELIDRDYANENFKKEPHCFKLPVEGFYLYEETSGLRAGTWTVFFVEADGDETNICNVITVGELNNVLRVIKANLASVHAIWTIRDNVLHERSHMAEAGFDSDQVNAVLGIIDDATSGLDTSGLS